MCVDATASAVLTEAMMSLTPGSATMPWRPFLFDSTTIASSKRFASLWKNTQSCSYDGGCRAYLELGGIGDATVQPEVLYGPYAMGRCGSRLVSIYSALFATGLTTQDLSNVESWVLLCEQLPGTNDAIGRIDQCAIHIEEATNAQIHAVSELQFIFGEKGTCMASKCSVTVGIVEAQDVVVSGSVYGLQDPAKFRITFRTAIPRRMTRGVDRSDRDPLGLGAHISALPTILPRHA